MGMIKTAVIFCVVLVILTYLRTFLEPRLPTVVDGYFHPTFQSVAVKFRENVRSGKERGAAIAVYYKGELVVDMWGGYADLEAGRPWQKDTITVGFSNTKGVAAIIVATMVEKGYLEYKRPVADYWPEFGQNGKGNITVEMLLSHQAGLVALDNPVSLMDLRDNKEKVEQTLATQSSEWPAGTAHGYHTISYGLYVDTLLRKADPKGRDTAQIFYEDIAQPFDLDMYMNTPREQFYRATRVYQDPPWKVLVKALLLPRYANMFFHMIVFPESLIARSLQAVVEFSSGVTDVYNNPYLREIPQSCCHGTGTARGFAKLYSIIANGGVLGNKRLLKEETIQQLATRLTTGRDVNTGFDNVFGPGTMILNNTKGQPLIGHTGHGGQVAMADIHNHLGISYLTNFISVHGYGDDPRYLDLETEIYKCLDKYVSTRND